MMTGLEIVWFLCGVLVGGSLAVLALAIVRMGRD